MNIEYKLEGRITAKVRQFLGCIPCGSVNYCTLTMESQDPLYAAFNGGTWCGQVISDGKGGYRPKPGAKGVLKFNSDLEWYGALDKNGIPCGDGKVIVLDFTPPRFFDDNARNALNETLDSNNKEYKLKNVTSAVENNGIWFGNKSWSWDYMSQILNFWCEITPAHVGIYQVRQFLGRCCVLYEKEIRNQSENNIEQENNHATDTENVMLRRQPTVVAPVNEVRESEVVDAFDVESDILVEMPESPSPFPSYRNKITESSKPAFRSFSYNPNSPHR